ncbi:MAG: hypothetical protein AB8F65_12755 [Woeseiaceae bacterium]
MIILMVMALALWVSEAGSSPERATDTKDALPDFSAYPGQCPSDWGIVEGAPQAHVENFIQNYFYVPEGPAGGMYSRINKLSAPGGATIIKAGTYKMLDPIVDQEMVVKFVGGAMTECVSRLRCETDPETWVASCD